MGVTVSLVYIAPHILPFRINPPVRLYVAAMVQILICLVETWELVRKEVRDVGRESFHQIHFVLASIKIWLTISNRILLDQESQ